MLKPGSLRDHLTAAIPQLRTDPSKLSILIKSGGLSARLTTSLAFEYNYTLQVLLLDYSGHPDAVMLPILIWLRQHQPDLLDNPERQTDRLGQTPAGFPAAHRQLFNHQRFDQ